MQVAKRLLVLSSTDLGDANSVTDVILLTKAGLTSSKILSQVYDGASVMAGHYGGLQHLLQERENRKIPYVHCLHYQVHIVVVHAMSIEQAINYILLVCGSLYNFFASPQLHFAIMVTVETPA